VRSRAPSLLHMFRPLQSVCLFRIPDASNTHIIDLQAADTLLVAEYLGARSFLAFLHSEEEKLAQLQFIHDLLQRCDGGVLVPVPCVLLRKCCKAYEFALKQTSPGALLCCRFPVQREPRHSSRRANSESFKRRGCCCRHQFRR